MTELGNYEKNSGTLYPKNINELQGELQGVRAKPVGDVEFLCVLIVLECIFSLIGVRLGKEIPLLRDH